MIRHWAGKPVPMYGNGVDELHLEIDGKHYVVRIVDGKPVIEAVTP